MFSAAIKSGAAASTPVDAQFNYVTMLLHGDGTNGANNGGVNTSGVTPFNTDASTNAFPVTINGDTKPNNFNPYQAGYYGNSFGSANFFYSASNADFAFGTSDFTVEAWVNPSSYGTLSYVMGIAVTDGLVFYVNSGNLVVRAYNTGDLLSSSTIPALNTWTHVAATRSGTTLRIFVNGVQTATTTNSTNFAQGAIYAANDSTNAAPWYGYISNLRVVKGTALYTSAFTPSTTPLTAISGTSWLVCQSNRFIDNSTSPKTITISGSPSVSYNQPFTVPSTYSTYGAGYFDGTGDYLTSTVTAIGTSNLTVEFWIYPFDASATYHCVYDNRESGDGSSGYGIFQYGSVIEVYTSGLVVSSVSGSIKINAWTHVAFVRNSSSCQLYINGVASGSSASNSTNAYSTQRRIGTASTTPYYYQGYITDLRENVTAVYTTTFTPPTAPLSAISGTQLLTLQTNGPVNDNGFVDSSTNNFAITRNGNTTQGSFSPYGSNWSNYFDGSSAYMTAGSASDWTFLHNGASDWTVEYWMFNNNNTTRQESISTNTNATGGAYGITFAHFLSTGNLLVQIVDGIDGNNLLCATTTAPIAANTWNHIAVTFTTSTKTMKIYVNGVLQATNTNTGYAYGSSAPNFTLQIGRWIGSVSGTGGYLNGSLSNLRIVNGSVVYTAAFTPPTAPLTAITNTTLLTCQSNCFVDKSASPKAITIGGTPIVQRFNPFGTSTAYSTATIGGSGYFDGSGDYLQATAGAVPAIGTGDFTLSGWWYLNELKNYQILFDLRNGSDGAYPYLYVSAVGVGDYYVSSTTHNLSTSFKANQWLYIVLSRVSGTTKIFVNGVEGLSYSDSTNYLAGRLTLGVNNNGGTAYYYNGYISDFKIVIGTGTTSGTPTTSAATATSGTQALLSMTNAGIYDNAMMNNLETVGNAQVSSSVKKFGTGSMYFDGTGDYLLSPNINGLTISGTQNFTIEAWIYPTEASNFHAIYCTGYPIQMYIANNKIYFYASSGNSGGYEVDGLLGPASSISANTWSHVAVVRNGTSFTAYVNGVAGTPITSSVSIAYPTFPSISVGTYAISPNTYPWIGYIDDLRITKGYARYTANFTPPIAPFPNIGPVNS